MIIEKIRSIISPNEEDQEKKLLKKIFKQINKGRKNGTVKIKNNSTYFSKVNETIHIKRKKNCIICHKPIESKYHNSNAQRCNICAKIHKKLSNKERIINVSNPKNKKDYQTFLDPTIKKLLRESPKQNLPKCPICDKIFIPNKVGICTRSKECQKEYFRKYNQEIRNKK